MSDTREPATSGDFGFFEADGETPLRSVDLRHLGADRFSLMESFMYRGPSGQWLITQEGLPDTDLVSVPWFLQWFVPPYGPHLLAALTHDWLMRNDEMSRSEADAVFDEALGVSRIPRVRRAMMAAAVTFSTRFGTGGWARVGIVVWFALSILGTLIVLNAIGGWWDPPWWNSTLVLIAAVAPVAASVLWGNQWRQGIVGGYSLLLLAPASLVIVITAAIYAVLEWLVPGYNRAPRDLREMASSDTES